MYIFIGIPQFIQVLLIKNSYCESVSGTVIFQYFRNYFLGINTI